MTAGKSAALGDVRVIDLTQIVSGSVATMMLADFGAEVIKVEPPVGEPYRRFGTPVQTPAGSENLNALRFNRNKKSVVIDLKREDGRAVLRDLVSTGDVVLENFRPGVMKRLGFSYEDLQALNGQIVYTSVSGFGDAADAGGAKPAYAILAEAEAGLMHLAGDKTWPPVWMGFAMSDIFSGVLAFAGTLLALEEVRAGRGHQRVDVSMLDASILMNDLAINAYEWLGQVTERGQYPLQAPWGPFEVRDGYVAIAVMADHEWQALCRIIGRPDLAVDERLSTGTGRSEHIDLIRAALLAWTRQESRKTAVEALQQAGVPCAPVNDASDVVTAAHDRARGMLIDVEHALVGRGRVVGNPINSTVPDRLAATSQIPRLGEHTVETLRSVLDCSPEQIDEWLRSGTVAGADPAPAPCTTGGAAQGCESRDGSHERG